MYIYATPSGSSLSFFDLLAGSRALEDYCNRAHPLILYPGPRYYWPWGDNLWTGFPINEITSLVDDDGNAVTGFAVETENSVTFAEPQFGQRLTARGWFGWGRFEPEKELPSFVAAADVQAQVEPLNGVGVYRVGDEVIVSDGTKLYRGVHSTAADHAQHSPVWRIVAPENMQEVCKVLSGRLSRVGSAKSTDPEAMVGLDFTVRSQIGAWRRS